MPNLVESLYNIRILDELAEKRTIIHNIHPLMKVLTTGVYLMVTVSFGKYELSGLLPLIFYPVVLITLADIPIVPIFKRVLLVLPLIIGIGLFNPLFDKNPMIVLPWIQISGGWISFFSILIKGFLTILAALILIATTGMTRIASALRIMRIPRLFIMQLLLTYRYISVLIEEVGRVVRAYSLRSPGEKGIRFSNWGSLTGQLLIRTLERAQRVYHSMCCRGFAGEYNVGREKGMGIGDIVYFVGWSLYFVIIRYFNIPAMIGSLMMGVGK
ncbi:MAG: cobalt/nickel transport system permease protein [Clostridia bacterium]|nr:cobalt transporter, inner rane subunit CbiQ [Clostridiales bacterium]MDK2985559.1 cobalt/nickel transport system permease protein [Clostridia bacterium]